MADYQLGVIGGGNMAEALLRGVIGSVILARNTIVVSDPAVERRRHLSNTLRLMCVPQNAVPGGCPHVLLAVKPQVMPAVLDELAPVVGDDALVISIAAGITTRFVDERLKGRGRIVRVMPNTPMLAGEGMSALCAGARAADEDLHWAERLFATGGRTVVVDEDMMDAVTAVSGSGPAYLFYLIEAMIAAGVAEGLPQETAAVLAAQTCLGASRLLADSGERPEVLRARVTSPGGTTQRAIETMDSAGVKASLIAAIRAAAERSGELGK